jgi:hypothetical protein
VDEKGGAAMADTDVEEVAEIIAAAVGSQVFTPLHDAIEFQHVRDQFRKLARKAIAINERQVSVAHRSVTKRRWFGS